MLHLNIEDRNYNVVETSGDITARVTGVSDNNGVIKVNNILSQSKINDNPQVGIIRIKLSKKLFCGELIYRFNSSTTKILKESLDSIDEYEGLNVDLICYNYPILILSKISTCSNPNQVLFQLDSNLLDRWTSCSNYSINGKLN